MGGLMSWFRRKAVQKRHQGFTTPEMLMTILVFSMGLLPLIVLFQSSHRTTAQAKNLMVAQSLGRSLIDEIRSLGFEGIRQEIENPTGVFHDFQQVSGPVVRGDDQGLTYPEYYRRFETKIAASGDNETGKYRIELEVRWQEPNRTFSLGFGTVVVRYGAK
jgi:Tfp pilus assembly protein PilV